MVYALLMIVDGEQLELVLDEAFVLEVCELVTELALEELVALGGELESV